MGIFIYCCRHKKNIGYIGYYLFILCTQKNYWIYRVFLYIVVDTKTKKEYIGYYLYIVVDTKTKKEYIGYYLYIVVDTKTKKEYIGYYLLNLCTQK